MYILVYLTAQKNGRETQASGIGWELFKNYLIAKEKFRPDYFLYENNKSAAEPIKAQIRKELGVYDGTLFTPYSDVRYTEINSALVSAQNRQRFYVTNFGDIEQPEDRGILLRDILESGTDLSQNEKGYCLTASYDGACAFNTPERGQRTMVAEPVGVTPEGKSFALTAYYSTGQNPEHTLKKSLGSMVAEPINVTAGGKAQTIRACYYKDGIRNLVGNDIDLRTAVAEPVRIGTIESEAKNKDANSQGYRAYSADGKSVTLCGNGRGGGAKTGLYAVPYNGGTARPIYEVRNGYITIKDKRYPIKLRDGYYIIRKLTVTECCRLQTMPDDYCRAVSASQGFRGLGNGWTAEVIIHLLNHAKIPLDEEIQVLSMYDGIGTGRYCLDKMGYKNVKYHAYEIDKYAMQVANSNYPDIIQHGDAFQVREFYWRVGKKIFGYTEQLKSKVQINAR